MENLNMDLLYMAAAGTASATSWELLWSARTTALQAM